MASTASTGGTGPVPLQFGQTGLAREIIGLAIANWLLSILTLGIYRFWARTRVRRYLWGSTQLNGEALEYTGTGWEIFASFLMALVVFLLPLGALYYALTYVFLPASPEQIAAAAGLYLGVLFVAHYAIYRARAYLLSRTHWQSVRFAQSGSGIPYALLATLYLFLSVITLGLYAPFAKARLTGRMRRNTWFGNRRFAFHGSGGGLFRAFFVSWLLTIALLGSYAVLFGGPMLSGFAELSALPPDMNLPRSEMARILGEVFPALLGLYALAIFGLPVIWAFYNAYEMNYLARHTSLDGVSLRMTATGLSLIWLWLGNMLILGFTFGIGLPFAQVRLMRYWIHRLDAEGTLDLEATLQSEEPQPRFGEGLADGLDVLPI